MIERISKISEIVSCTDRTYRQIIFAKTHELHFWRVRPGEWIYPHIHPHNDDTWYIIEGMGEYYITAKEKKTVTQGDLTVALPGNVHGIFNSGTEDLVILSILSPLPVDMEEAPGFKYPE